MSKAESSRKTDFVKGGIAEFLMADMEIMLDIKFGNPDKKELAKDYKLREKSIKEFADDMIEVFAVDPEKLQQFGVELIAEMTASMNSSLADLVQQIGNSKPSKSQSSKKRKGGDEVETLVAKKRKSIKKK